MGLRLSIRNNHEAGALPEMVPLGSRKEAETQGCPEAVMEGNMQFSFGSPGFPPCLWRVLAGEGLSLPQLDMSLGDREVGEATCFVFQILGTSGVI